MGNRLSRIFTRTGDEGTTGLGDGTRVAKDCARVEAYGTVDECNSAVGMVLAVPGVPAGVLDILVQVQHDLFDLGGELCIPGHRAIFDRHVERLEQSIESFNATLPPLKEFILPGGGQAAPACHLARTIARRAERRGWTLATHEGVAPEPMRYLNRLSDLLFVLARVLARHETGHEVLWEHEVDGRVVDPDAAWDKVDGRGFDEPRLFSAFLNTLRWHCVTATDPRLFQAPYRAGIEVKSFQLEPLRKALLMPRVNLFIADDTGAGKTIEAGLVTRELIMRQKVRRIVVCAPPSVVRQWKDEMEQRFGLT